MLYSAKSLLSGIVNISRDGLRREDQFEETEDEVRFGVMKDRMKEFP